MKASLKFREEQKPIFKAKVPLSILGLPFQSGISAGDTKELSLSLATLFDSGPSFRVSYRPNDALNPFSLIIKSGIGHFGSPLNAPMTMSAEFNFLGNDNNSSGINPRFFIHFKPNFGDFSIKKSQSSVISDFTKVNKSGAVFEEDGEMVEKPSTGDYFSSAGKITSLPLRSSVESAVQGVELGAKTVLPVRNGAVLKLRWGVKFPEGFQDLFRNPTGRMSPRGIPLLVLNKIGIEHVAKEDKKKEDVVGPQGGGGSAELAETCFSVKRQLETLRSENAVIGKALEDLKAEFGNRGFVVMKNKGERKPVDSEVDGEGLKN